MCLNRHPPDRFAIPAVGKNDVHLAIAPFLAPLPQRQYDRQKALPFGTQRIDHAAAILGVRRAFEDSTRNQLGETIREDVASDSQTRLELLEMMEAVERAAKDQERPLLADQLDRGRNGAAQRCFLETIDFRRERVCRHWTDLP